MKPERVYSTEQRKAEAREGYTVLNRERLKPERVYSTEQRKVEAREGYTILNRERLKPVLNTQKNKLFFFHVIFRSQACLISVLEMLVQICLISVLEMLVQIGQAANRAATEHQFGATIVSVHADEKCIQLL